MEKLFVAWQDEDTREWIPVAMLNQINNGYSLQYTRGVKRCKNFTGLGRMSALDKTYFSEELFPFFANRMISKSRPEYKKFLSWLGLDDVTGDPVSVLSVTGGLRATDSFELVPAPRRVGEFLKFDFFPRGLRHLPTDSIQKIHSLLPGERLYLLRDIQNTHDSQSLLLRTDSPKSLVGHVAKYYCSWLSGLMNTDPDGVTVKVKLVNADAPLDMRLLCTLEAPWKDGFQLFETENDFLPLNKESIGESYEIILKNSNLELG